MLWKAAVADTNGTGSSGNTYALDPCLEIGGKWYADISIG